MGGNSSPTVVASKGRIVREGGNKGRKKDAFRFVNEERHKGLAKV